MLKGVRSLVRVRACHTVPRTPQRHCAPCVHTVRHYYHVYTLTTVRHLATWSMCTPCATLTTARHVTPCEFWPLCRTCTPLPWSRCHSVHHGRVSPVASPVASGIAPGWTPLRTAGTRKGRNPVEGGFHVACAGLRHNTRATSLSSSTPGKQFLTTAMPKTPSRFSASSSRTARQRDLRPRPRHSELMETRPNTDRQIWTLWGAPSSVSCLPTPRQLRQEVLLHSCATCAGQDMRPQSENHWRGRSGIEIPLECTGMAANVSLR